MGSDNYKNLTTKHNFFVVENEKTVKCMQHKHDEHLTEKKMISSKIRSTLTGNAEKMAGKCLVNQVSELIENYKKLTMNYHDVISENDEKSYLCKESASKLALMAEKLQDIRRENKILLSMGEVSTKKSHVESRKNFPKRKLNRKIPQVYVKNVKNPAEDKENIVNGIILDTKDLSMRSKPEIKSLDLILKDQKLFHQEWEARNKAFSKKEQAVTNKNFETKIDTVLKENTSLHLQISQLITAVKSSGVLIKEALAEKENAEYVIDDLKRENVQISQANEKLQSDLGVLLKKNYDSLKRIEQLNDDVEALEGHISSINADKDAVEIKLKYLIEEKLAIQAKLRKSWSCAPFSRRR